MDNVSIDKHPEEDIDGQSQEANDTEDVREPDIARNEELPPYDDTEHLRHL